MSYAMAARAPGDPSVIEQVPLAMPDPGPQEVVIRQTAVGVNFLDVYFRKGLYPWPGGDGAALVLGSEAAGVIESVGESVTGFRPGDRVAYTLANNAYATHRLIEARHVVPIPDGVSDEVAAASMLKGLTVHYLLHRSFAVTGDHTVLFHAAAGGVGLFAGQWLRAKGAKAIGTAGGPEKCALAGEHGYGEVIDYRATDFTAQVRELTGGTGVDVVYDSVGADTYPGSLQCLRDYGTWVTFGQSSGAIENFTLKDLAAGNFFATRPTLFNFTKDRAWLTQAASDLFGLIADGTLRVQVNNTAPLSEAGDIHRKLEARETTGSTVLIP